MDAFTKRYMGVSMLEIKPLDEGTRESAVNLITEHWGAPVVVSRGKVHHARDLSGFIAAEDGKMAGLVTYAVENGECEIVSLDSLVENRGIGSALIDRVVAEARRQKCGRVWLITTNDNTHAIRYYQKRGFSLVGIHINAVQEARKIKPQIPLYGFDDIPIMHEIEFEIVL